MENRFTVKDLVYFAVLALIVLLVLLAMYQVDRQWLRLTQMEQSLREQAEDLRVLRQMLARGVPARSGVAPDAPDAARAGHDGDIPPVFRRAWQAQQQPDYAPGDWLVQAFGVNLKSITPFISEDAYAAEVQGYVLESLLLRDPDTLEWQGLLASDWTVSDDGLTFRFRLRPEARFSDGEPVTAEDVAFSWRFIMNEAIQAPRERAYYRKIDRVTVLGPHEEEFHFAEPYYDALSLAGGMPILPKHFYAPYLKDPNAFNQSKGLLLGSGPYRLADPRNWSPDAGMVELLRNPRYWGPVQPSFDRLIWRIIENDSARLTTFRNGDIDTYGARPREYRKLLADKAFMDRVQHWEYMSPVAGYSYIGWNQSRKGKPTWFADRRVRQAMTLLTDRQRIIDEIFLGYAEIAVSPFNPRSPQHDPSVRPWPVDRARAEKLLAEAGFRDRNGDGVLEDAEGRPFEFELVFFQGNDDTRRMVLLLKDLYARAGILLRPRPTEWSVMIDLLKKRDFDAITLGWTSGLETDLYQMFHSSQIEGGGNDFVGYRNPELDRLIEQARRTVDEKARMKLWHAAERILHEDQPYTFLMRRKSLLFIDRRIHNVKKTRIGLNLGLVPVEVYVPRAEQRYRK